MVAAYDDAWRVNVAGTRHVLDAARAAGVERFVHFSSVAVFGTDYPDGVEESYPVRVSGRSSYADTKIGAEAVVLAAHARGETRVTVVRPGDVYGPGSVWIREPLALLRSRRMLLPDGGRGTFAPVFVDDLVEGVLLATTHERAVGEVITLGPAAGVSCADYFGRLAAAVGRRIPTLPAAVALPAVTAVGATLRRAGVRTEIGPASLDFLNRPGRTRSPRPVRCWTGSHAPTSRPAWPRAWSGPAAQACCNADPRTRPTPDAW